MADLGKWRPEGDREVGKLRVAIRRLKQLIISEETEIDTEVECDPAGLMGNPPEGNGEGTKDLAISEQSLGVP